MTANSLLNNRVLIGWEADANRETVVAAALEMPYGTKLSSRHLMLLELPDGTAPKNTFRTFEEVEGHVAKAAIEPGEVLLQSRFVEHNQGSTLAALVAENMRAVTVRVNDVVGVAGFLLPGNRVDVLSIRGGRGNTRATSDTVLNNIKVLAVDQTTATEKNDPIIVRAVTLELSPSQALVLVKAKAEGEIQLTLRNPVDTQTAKVEPAKPGPVVKPAPIFARTVVPTSTTVQVIRGTNVRKEKTKM
jgi:pilus assembly protein CpaB